MKNDLVITQKKIIRIVGNYFKKNSPFLKKNYFALYENGGGSQHIKENIYYNKKNFFKKFLSNNLNIFNNSNLKILSNINQEKYYNNLVITWGNRTSFSSNGTFYDKYFSTYSSKHNKTFWIVLLSREFKNIKQHKNIAIVYPKKNLVNNLKFVKIFFLNLINNFFRKKNNYIDQDFIISKCINEYISKNKNLFKLKNLIMPYEGQAFQKRIFSEQKIKNKKIKTYGFDHSAPHSIATHLYHTRGSPDKLLVSGANTKKIYVKYYNWPSKKIQLTFPARYKNFNKYNFVNKMFLPYDFTNMNKILQGLSAFLQKSKNKSLKKFNINIHPVKKEDKKHIILKEEIEKIQKIYKEKFIKNSTNNITITVGFTTTPIVALEFKSSVLHICPNPDFDAYLNCFWPDIKIKKINKYCFFYSLKKNGNYLNFNNKNRILEIINDRENKQ